MSAISEILVNRTDCVGHIVLNRPQAINAINQLIRVRLPEIVAQLDLDPSVHVILITGHGERGFSVGADIKEMTRADAAINPARTDAKSWIESIDQVSKPVIAAIHGFCLGGGFELALACDIRIAAPTAVFGLPEVNLGLIPGGGGTQRLTRIVGMGRALDMLLSADRISAQEAYRVGLVTRITTDNTTLIEEAFAFARHVAAKPRLAIAAVKEAVRSGSETTLEMGLRRERELFARLAATEDHREAASAFRDKRTPVFNGR